MVVGTLADIVEEQSDGTFRNWVLPRSIFSAARADDLPPVGPGTRFCCAALPERYGLGVNQTRRQVDYRTLSIGVDGTLAWFQAAAAEWG
ncbi:MAG: hypothetical protein CM15mP74_31450 [Halieaceae bacterium]|nr:MAG: hypothetical protein CM15mP74_31450 [Halieaceae bacterium]